MEHRAFQRIAEKTTPAADDGSHGRGAEAAPDG
jgi:hypothetical protein